MENQDESFKKLQEKFVAAGKKDEFIIPAAALQAGLDFEAVEAYMPPSLDSGQLLEMMAAILDGVSEQILEQFKTGKFSASDMREMRLGNRGDVLMQNLFQEVSNLTELVGRTGYQDQLKIVAKMCRDIKKDLAQIKEQDVKDANMKREESSRKDEAVSEGSIEDLQRLEEGAGQEVSKTGQRQVVPEEEQEGPGGEYYHEETDSIIAPVLKPRKNNRFLAFFRRINTGKIEDREEEKKLSVMNFMQKDLDEERLTAALEAVRKGVPYEHLSHVVDSDCSAEKIRLLTSIYLYIFNGEAPAAYTPA